MRITFKGKSAETLGILCDILNASPTEVLVNRIYDLEKQFNNKARIEEVKNELQKEPDKTL